MDKRRGFAPLEVRTGGGHGGSPGLFPTGFTLLELLVVVSIAALLTSILVPALNKAKTQAKDLLGASRLHELGGIWQMYTDENDGKFMERGCGDSEGAVTWFHSIGDYYSDPELLLCPLAVKTREEGERTPYAAWDKIIDSNDYYRGSYGINLWVSNGAGIGATECPDSVGENFESLCWRTPSVRGASYGPLILCSQWKDMQPYPWDAPPEYEWDKWTSGPTNEMRRVCIKRHSPYHVRVLYLDLSVDKKTIKEVWRLRWHKEWPPDYPLPIWEDEAPWMEGVPDPD
ncbi:MAG: type II secretion system protein [Planctomycetota bacterium]|jgi:prepilin-type N-terminal cleavage/methylation domain-containing protein